MNTFFSINLGKQRFCAVLGVALVLGSSIFLNSTPVYAYACTLPSSIESEHEDGRDSIKDHITEKFEDHRKWLTDKFAVGQVIPALQDFTEQMSAVAMQQTMIIGTFFDAKHQLETQRLFQELQVEAHKDYQPSAGLCAFGTNVRSLGHSEAVGRFDAQVLGQRQLARHLGQVNMAGTQAAEDDKVARWRQFTMLYCDGRDNDWIDGKDETGLIPPGTEDSEENWLPICNAPSSNSTNIDIDYTRAIENRRTLDILRPYDVGTPDETDTQALGNNLYGHNVLFRTISPENILKGDKPKLYMKLRAIAAKRNVAENSYNSILGMKSIGSASSLIGNVSGLADIDAEPQETYKFLAAVLTELGIPEEEVVEYIGLPKDTYEPHFSYYSQLEILAKKIFQNPDFYANLYDKPANVKRISAALNAIELMVDRAIYESQLRQEMSMSVLLSSRLQAGFEEVNKNLSSSSE